MRPSAVFDNVKIVVQPVPGFSRVGLRGKEEQAQKKYTIARFARFRFDRSFLDFEKKRSRKIVQPTDGARFHTLWLQGRLQSLLSESLDLPDEVWHLLRTETDP
jgi:hypothetical protein